MKEEHPLDKYTFEVAFLFFSSIFGSLGTDVPFPLLVKRLIEVAKGELSLKGSPQEIIARVEREVSKPLPDNLRQSVFQMDQNRSEGDARNSATARFALEIMGVSIPE